MFKTLESLTQVDRRSLQAEMHEIEAKCTVALFECHFHVEFISIKKVLKKVSIKNPFRQIPIKLLKLQMKQLISSKAITL